jgi:hypothetical protein
MDKIERTIELRAEFEREGVAKIKANVYGPVRVYGPVEEHEAIAWLMEREERTNARVRNWTIGAAVAAMVAATIVLFKH